MKDCLDYELLKNALASLPKTLDDTYGRILESIPECHRRKAVRILQFLAFATRPLSIEEMVDAVAVNLEGERCFDPKNRMPEPREISRYCSSLVIVASIRKVLPGDNSEILILQLAHFSVREYLASSRVHKAFTQVFEKTMATESVMQVCRAYLDHVNQDHKLKEDNNLGQDVHSKQRIRYLNDYHWEQESQELIRKYPLVVYCAWDWVEQAAPGQGYKDKVGGLVLKILCCENDGKSDDRVTSSPNFIRLRGSANLFMHAHFLNVFTRFYW